MKKIFKCIFLSSILLGAASVSVAEDADRVYVSLGAGLSKTKNIKNSNLPILSTIGVQMTEPNDLSLKFKNGTAYRVALGYRASDIRTELELSHIRAKYKMFSAGNGQHLAADAQGKSVFPGHAHTFAALANVYYDFNCLNSYFTPYLGVGLGLVSARNEVGVELVKTQDNAIVQTYLLKGKINENKLGYQGVAGFRVALTKEMSVMADYRYLATAKLKAFERKFENHSINLGLMYQF